MSQTRFLDILKPVIRILPEVGHPDRRVRFEDKMIWTTITLFIYLVCCQIPIFGVEMTKGGDPFQWIRVIIASNKGTLMELGITPVITSSMVMELLSGVKIINVNKRLPEDRKLFNGAEKLLGILITFGEAVAYVLSGMYGDVQQIGGLMSMFIIFQLCFAGFIVILLDEVLKNGYGLGSGISLFIATNICENIFWRCFSPITISSGNVPEFEGCLINVFHLMFTKTSKWKAFQDSIFRVSGPNLSNLFATILIFIIVIYFQGFKVDLNLKSEKQRGNEQAFPIKLFYTSSMPVILMSAMVANFHFFSHILYKKMNGNFLIGLLGQWQELQDGRQGIPVGGLAYYISPPRDVIEFIRNPTHSLLYVAFVLIACGLLSRFWIEISGQSAKEIYKNLHEQNLNIKTGLREKGAQSELAKYINPAATFGGMCIGLLTILADLLGAIGSGSGILLAVTIIYQYIESIQNDKKHESNFIG